ncbi:MAG: DUF6273 domain-containing protein [Eubacteriales bacterium]|nr:DUF6273 domain-containing protein [Eubacteriales bacterium]
MYRRRRGRTKRSCGRVGTLALTVLMAAVVPGNVLAAVVPEKAVETVISGKVMPEKALETVMPGKALIALMSGNTLTETGNVLLPVTGNEVECGERRRDENGRWECDESGSWVHRSAAGELDRGWFRDVDGGWYQLSSDGVMLAARWFQDTDGRWYYLHVDGRMLAGQWFQDADGAWYYLSESGAMMSSCVTPDGYTLLHSGVWDVSVPRKTGTGMSGGGGSGSSRGGSSGSGGSGSHGGAGSSGSNGDSSHGGAGSSGSNHGWAGSSGSNGSSSHGEVGSSGSYGGAGSSGSSGNANIGDSEADKDSGETTGGTIGNMPATPSDAAEAVVAWQVHFVDRETHQIVVAPTRSGTIREGEELVVNFRQRVIDSENRIWEAREMSPIRPIIYGPGNWLYYVEYEQTGVVSEQENPFEAEENRLAQWLETAKKAESGITGEESEEIPDSRFLAEQAGESDARLLTIADQIPAASEPIVYVIGKNMMPNGIILEKMYRDEIEYAHMVEDRIQVGADTFYVCRFTIRREDCAENCQHRFEEESRSEPTGSSHGTAVYTCARCGLQEEVILPAIGQEERIHWNIGDVQARELDGEIYLFRCIDQNYGDGMETHRESALFLCDSVIPADFGSDYSLEPDENGRFDYHFTAGPIVNFGEKSDYKYSGIRAWLTDSEENFADTEPVNIGVSRAYTGSTEAGMYSQFQEAKLTGSYIGSQRLSGKLFILSVDEAVRYKEYLWKFDGAEEDNPESQVRMFCKGYWLRTPEGNTQNHDTGRMYMVDLVNGNLHPCEISPEGGTAEEELNVTGTTGVRPVFTMPQG